MSDGSSDGGDPCAYTSVDGYDRSLNIGAVFIILAASVLGTAIPLVSKHYPAMQRYPFVFIWGKHVGTGVLLALGLIHLLAPAFDELGNTCLPDAWQTYQYAPLFCLLAALAMHFIETIAYQYMDSHMGQTPAGPAGPYEAPGSPTRQTNPDLTGPDSDMRKGGTEVELQEQNGLKLRSPHQADAPDCVVIESSAAGSGEKVHIHSHKHTEIHVHTTPDGHTHTHGLGAEDGHMHSLLLGNAQRTVAAYILEFGLTAHSVIIGITVGVAARSELNTLIPALCFHQFFEGFALGARLAEVGFSVWSEITLLLVYSLSCPFGIAIGIGITSSYNENGTTANLVEGSFDAISAGIILYVGFVQMLAVEFTKDYKNARGDARKQVALWCGLYFGAGIMAFIGKYL